MNPSPADRRRHLQHIAAIVSLAGSILLLLFILACNIWIISATKSQVFNDIPSLPVNRDGLLLATGKLMENGRVNQHFVRRVDAAAALYRAGKVQRLILSGDKAHDEPMELKRALLTRGVPESALVLDNSGLRTLNSVVRARDVFHCGNLTIISERFHDFRALFLSRYYGIHAVAYAPPDLPFRWMLKSTLRESLARVKAILDLYILHTKPTVASGSPLVCHSFSDGRCHRLTRRQPCVTNFDIRISSFVPFASSSCPSWSTASPPHHSQKNFYADACPSNRTSRCGKGISIPRARNCSTIAW